MGRHFYVNAVCRPDVIVDYLGERFIVELKIWRGEEYHKCIRYFIFTLENSNILRQE